MLIVVLARIFVKHIFIIILINNGNQLSAPAETLTPYAGLDYDFNKSYASGMGTEKKETDN